VRKTSAGDLNEMQKLLGKSVSNHRVPNPHHPTSPGSASEIQSRNRIHRIPSYSPRDGRLQQRKFPSVIDLTTLLAMEPYRDIIRSMVYEQPGIAMSGRSDRH
jgi:hypothetical protein